MNQIVTNSRKLLRKEKRRQNRLESSGSWTWLHVRITWQMFYKIQIPGPYPRPIELTCLRIYSSLEATREQWFSKYLPRPAKSASPGSLLEIQIFGPHPQTNGNRNSVFLQGFQMIRMHSLKFWEPLPWDVGSMEAGTWSDVFIDEPSKALGTENMLLLVCYINGPQWTLPPCIHTLVPHPLGAGLVLFNEQNTAEVVLCYFQARAVRRPSSSCFCTFRSP